jgi:hypothetical protein
LFCCCGGEKVAVVIVVVVVVNLAGQQRKRFTTGYIKPMTKTQHFNSSPAIMPLAALYFGFLFLKGRFSLKNGTYCPLFSHDTTFFTGTCLFIYLNILPDGLYVFNGQLDIPVLNNIRKRTV